MIKARFYLPLNGCNNDYRPVIWPIKYPYWCTGYSGNGECAIIVAYVEDGDLYKQWPELIGMDNDESHLEYETVDKVEFNSRFQRPDWYTDEYIKKYDPSKVKVYWTGKKKEQKTKKERFIEKFGYWWYIRDLDFLPQPCEDNMQAFKMSGKWLDLIKKGTWIAFNNFESACQASNTIRKTMGMKDELIKYNKERIKNKKL